MLITLIANHQNLFHPTGGNTGRFKHFYVDYIQQHLLKCAGI